MLPFPARRRLLISAAVLLAAFTLPVHAQRSAPEPASIGASMQQVQRFDVPSADGKRHYTVTMLRPATAAPATGYPVLYALDGNSVMRALEGANAAGAPTTQVAVVTIDYADRPNADRSARGYDFLPLATDGRQVAPNNFGATGGGADALLTLIADVIRPKVEAMLPIDTTRQTLFGHSFGGVFVLHALYTRPELFQRYVAASPSLWWQDGLLMEEAALLEKAPTRAAGKQLMLSVGTRERRRGETEAPAPGTLPDAQRLAQRLQPMASRGGLQTSFELLEGMSHGQTLPASLGPALQHTQQ